MSSSPAPKMSCAASALVEQRDAVREQLSAAWQLHVSRIEEQLNTGWKEHIERVFEERFAEMAVQMEAGIATEVERRRKEASEELNRAMRMLSGATCEEEWAPALLDAARMFAPRAALFTVGARSLRASGVRSLPEAIANLEIPIAAAWESALATREPVTALRVAGEISEPLASLLDSDAGGNCHLFPITSQGRVASVLYTEGDVDTNGVEVIAALAGACCRIEPAKVRAAAPDWSQLTREEQDLHLRAQRFARVRVAEMRLYKSAAVRTGRARKELYSALKPEIDSAREAFGRDYIAASPAMPDYLHLELIRTLANDEIAVLGEDYPGPLF